MWSTFGPWQSEPIYSVGGGWSRNDCLQTLFESTKWGHIMHTWIAYIVRWHSFLCRVTATNPLMIQCHLYTSILPIHHWHHSYYIQPYTSPQERMALSTWAAPLSMSVGAPSLLVQHVPHLRHRGLWLWRIPHSELWLVHQGMREGTWASQVSTLDCTDTCL